MNSIKTTAFLCYLLVTFGAAGQVKKLWNRSFQENVQWQQVTSLGHYIAGTTQGLLGIDPDTGEVLWKAPEFGGISFEQVQQVSSSPLISVNKGQEVYMLDPFTGKIRFDSQKAGVTDMRDRFVLYKANGILISGKNSANKDILLMSSLATGEVAWTLQEDYGRLVTAQELSDKELLIVTIFYNYKVNAQTGKIIWKNDVSAANRQMASLGAFGNLVKQAAANMAQDVEFNVQFYKHPTDPVFFVASENESQSAMGQSDAVSYKTSYSAFSLKDGNRVWNKPLEVPGRMGPVYFHKDGLVILPDNSSNTKLNLFDYGSSEGKWGKKGRGVKVKGGIYSYAEVKGGLMLVSQNTNGKNFLSYLDTGQGLLTFDKPVKVDGEVVYSTNTPKGLLYITTEEINILNTADGTLVLSSPIYTRPSLAVQKENTLYAFDTKDGVLKALDINTGNVKVLSGKIKFEGKEDPANIEIRAAGILLSSSQNLALTDFGGTMKFQKYFEAPREPGIVRALRYAQAVRAAYIGAAAYTASTAFQTAGEKVKNDDPATGAVAQGIGRAYEQLGNAASDFAKKSFQKANARFKATKEADNYMVILAKQDKGNALLKINKNSGEVESTIDLGKEREPDYTMDGVTGQVFLRNGGSAITAFQF